DYYNVDVLGGIRVSDQAFQMNWNIAVGGSAKGALDCIRSWLTDSGFSLTTPRGSACQDSSKTPSLWSSKADRTVSAGPMP
ncbi:MAG: hypothetical protein ACXVCO_04790, partial [Ktedonobacterales bacterium]